MTGLFRERHGRRSPSDEDGQRVWTKDDKERGEAGTIGNLVATALCHSSAFY